MHWRGLFTWASNIKNLRFQADIFLDCAYTRFCMSTSCNNNWQSKIELIITRSICQINNKQQKSPGKMRSRVWDTSQVLSPFCFHLIFLESRRLDLVWSLVKSLICPKKFWPYFLPYNLFANLHLSVRLQTVKKFFSWKITVNFFFWRCYICRFAGSMFFFNKIK